MCQESVEFVPSTRDPMILQENAKSRLPTPARVSKQIENSKVSHQLPSTGHNITRT